MYEPAFPRRVFLLLVGLAVLGAIPAFWAAEVENPTVGLVAFTLVALGVLGCLCILLRHHLARFVGPRWQILAYLPPALLAAGFILSVWGYYNPGAVRGGVESHVSTAGIWLTIALVALGLGGMAAQLVRDAARKH